MFKKGCSSRGPPAMGHIFTLLVGAEEACQIEAGSRFFLLFVVRPVEKIPGLYS